MAVQWRLAGRLPRALTVDVGTGEPHPARITRHIHGKGGRDRSADGGGGGPVTGFPRKRVSAERGPRRGTVSATSKSLQALAATALPARSSRAAGSYSLGQAALE